jgi:hypothetical protein
MKWAETKRLKWKDRNAAVEAALRVFLNARAASLPALSTRELALALDPQSDKELSKVLLKLAPWMGVLATHDGAVFFAHGRKMQRWQWRGQRVEQQMENSNVK